MRKKSKTMIINPPNFNNKQVALVIAKYNYEITSSLLNGVLEVFNKCQLNVNNNIYYVPGAFEIPYMVNQLINQQKYDAIVCLGCLIKGKSDHYDSVRIAVVNQLCHLSCQSKTVIVNGILNVINYKQALQRSGLCSNSVNLGYEYAWGLCEMWKENEDKNV